MDPAIEQALTNLLPTINGRPPAELVQLATSLLAQSRTRASSLKADEEIARAYTCANLACERLKRSLNLPKIEPNPPCPPRVYRKLYNHLDQLSLAMSSSSTTTTTTTTSTKRTRILRDDGLLSSSVARPVGAVNPRTPTNGHAAAMQSSASRTPLKKQETLARPNASKLVLPDWISIAAEALCDTDFRAATVSYVVLGVETILTKPAPFLPNDPRASAEGKRDALPALVVAVCFFVNTRLSGKSTASKTYPEKRQKAVDLVNWLGSKQDAGDWETVQPEDVDDWMRDISARGWLRLDWLPPMKVGRANPSPSSSSLASAQNDQDAVVLGSDDDEAGHVGDSEDIRIRPRKKGRRIIGGTFGATRMDTLQCGLGTMMQEKVDYLGGKKRADYRVWHARIMGKIEELEIIAGRGR